MDKTIFEALEWVTGIFRRHNIPYLISSVFAAHAISNLLGLT